MSDELNKNNDPRFGLPPGYFGRSAESLAQKLLWTEELREFPRLSGLKDPSVFSVPENYFDAASVKLELLDLPILSNVSNKPGFITPDDYFDTAALDVNITLVSGKNGAKKSTEELFSVPAGYFEKKSAGLFNSVSRKNRGGRVISLRQGKRYAMAASLLIVFAVWLYQLYFAKPLVEDCGTIACVDRQDVVASKNFENFENEELYELVNTAELKEKLENKGAIKTPPVNDSAEIDELEEVYDDI